MKIALVSTGSGHVRRGFEQFSTDLFHQMEHDCDITLFKGGGVACAREVVIPHLSRDGILSHVPFIRAHPSRNPLYFEGLTFLAALLPRLIREQYDLVHYSAAPFENVFYHLRTKLGFKVPFRLLLTNGTSTITGHLNRVDFLHEITPFAAQNAMRFGISPEKIFSIPPPVDTEKFRVREERDVLRARYGIPQDKRVVLSVAALNRVHKRTDYLIREVARLGEDYFLLLVGHVEDFSLQRLARKQLGDRFYFPHSPFEKVEEIYHLADLFTVCSLAEGFCLAFVEAMSARLAVIAHDAPHFEWLIGDRRCLVDMSQDGNLARKIEQMLRDEKGTQDVVSDNYDRAVGRFDWSRLKSQYLDMYERISHGTAKGTSQLTSVWS